LLIAAGVTSVIVLLACSKKSETSSPAPVIDPVAAYLNLPSTPYNYSNPTLPQYLLTPNIQGQINTPSNNAVTDWGATLGRVLFYDKNLSFNKTIACASCHKQAFSFADPVQLSKGFNGGLTHRNSMSLIDAKYYPLGRFFWDQRAASLEIQTLTPIQDAVEMGMNLTDLENRLKTLPYYPTLFTKAFGDNNITSNRISLALSQFVRSIVSYQSKYDAGRQTVPPGQDPIATPFANFTQQENQGKLLFFSPQTACATCHGTETFTAPEAKNNGLDQVSTDLGFGAVTNNPADNATFKVSSLRNVELTAPYMHDGRFNTLEEVIEHYNSGIQANANLSPQLRGPGGVPRVLNLSVQDKAALVAFLKTLTDRNILTDVKYSDPFK
jgi:cytochrome c peroxidase